MPAIPAVLNRLGAQQLSQVCLSHCRKHALRSFTAHGASFGGQDAASSRAEKPLAATEPKKIPFYKRRNFIICQIVTAIIGIIMIFVLLWPVVRAIAQHVLDVSEMHIETSVIQSPSNESFTVRFLHMHLCCQG